jgi:hypothetical protein
VILRYIASLAAAGRLHGASISQPLGAIAALHIAAGLEPPTHDALVKLAARGFASSTMRGLPPPAEVRVGWTSGQVIRLLAWAYDRRLHFRALQALAIVVCQFVFWSRAVTIYGARGVDLRCDATGVVFHERRAKQRGPERDRAPRRQAWPKAPLTWSVAGARDPQDVLHEFVAWRASLWSADAPLFALPGGLPPAVAVNTEISMLLRASGMEPERATFLSSHSGRKGGCAAALALGVAADRARVWGDWRQVQSMDPYAGIVAPDPRSFFFFHHLLPLAVHQLAVNALQCTGE